MMQAAYAAQRQHMTHGHVPAWNVHRLIAISIHGDLTGGSTETEVGTNDNVNKRKTLLARSHVYEHQIKQKIKDETRESAPG